MKTNLSSGLATFLDNLCESGAGAYYTIVDLYTITTVNGVVMYLASWPNPITYNGHTYAAAQGYVERSKVRQALKCEVTQIQLKLYATPLLTLGGVPILEAIARGALTGATVKVDRLWSATNNPIDTSMGTMVWFVGIVAEVDELGRSHAVLTVKSPQGLLNMPHPRNLYLPSCRHTLFDPGCGLSSASFQVSGLVASGSTTVTVNTNLTQPGPFVAPAAPTLRPVTPPNSQYINLPAATYFVVITWAGPSGESPPSPEASLAISGGGMYGTTNNLLTVTRPLSYPAGVTGWNVYVGLQSGQELLQNVGPLPLTSGVFWEENGGGLVSGPPYPIVQSGGWFTNGVITFTSGACAGIEQIITQYTNPTGTAGIITTLPPLPVAPSALDSFVCLPGCDKTLTVCSSKFNNISNAALTPYIPLPEISA